MLLHVRNIVIWENGFSNVCLKINLNLSSHHNKRKHSMEPNKIRKKPIQHKANLLERQLVVMLVFSPSWEFNGRG